MTQASCPISSDIKRVLLSCTDRFVSRENEMLSMCGVVLLIIHLETLASDVEALVSSTRSPVHLRMAVKVGLWFDLSLGSVCALCRWSGFI